ncbi:unnamed protein product [Periconia digitata]|uniref:Uncharacterized protein n=1 Tax=Periconia digitata TaxID=1303443 RepID=A0A9W4U8Z2_9PLEO|nr:unnamed protein product [Periconia digitata]
MPNDHPPMPPTCLDSALAPPVRVSRSVLQHQIDHGQVTHSLSRSSQSPQTDPQTMTLSPSCSLIPITVRPRPTSDESSKTFHEARSASRVHSLAVRSTDQHHHRRVNKPQTQIHPRHATDTDKQIMSRLARVPLTSQTLTCLSFVILQ